MAVSASPPSPTTASKSVWTFPAFADENEAIFNEVPQELVSHFYQLSQPLKRNLQKPYLPAPINLPLVNGKADTAANALTHKRFFALLSKYAAEHPEFVYINPLAEHRGIRREDNPLCYALCTVGYEFLVAWWPVQVAALAKFQQNHRRELKIKNNGQNLTESRQLRAQKVLVDGQWVPYLEWLSLPDNQALVDAALEKLEGSATMIGKTADGRIRERNRLENLKFKRMTVDEKVDRMKAQFERMPIILRFDLEEYRQKLLRGETV